MNLKSTKFDSFEFDKNGEHFKYRIQTATGDQFDEIVEQLGSYFIKHESLSAAINYISDLEAYKMVINLWRDVVYGGTTLIAIIENDCVEQGKIIGVNFTYVAKKDERDKNLHAVSSNKKYIQITKVLTEVCEAGNIFEKCNVDRYLASVGLAVHEDFSGHGIGYRLLETREKLCKLLNISATGSVFSNYASQHLATKLGFEVLSSLDKEHIDFGDVECHLDDTNWNNIKLMARKYT